MGAEGAIALAAGVHRQYLLRSTRLWCLPEWSCPVGDANVAQTMASTRSKGIQLSNSMTRSYAGVGGPPSAAPLIAVRADAPN
jgi:hypothetical protein